MRYFHLLLANLKRRWLRTFFTVAAIAVAFVLFAVLGALNQAFNAGIDLAGEDRLVLRHKVSIIQLLPESYGPRIEKIPGVELVSHSTWFGGVYQDPKNFFPKIAVVPEELLDLYPEFLLPADQLEAWKATKNGVIVGADLAKRFGWKIGDRIPVQGDIWRKTDGGPWEFDLVGIYTGAEKNVDQSQLFLRYDYLYEARGGELALVGWYVVRIDDPERAPEIAEQIDQTFANSPAETKTSTEKAFGQAFAQQVGNTAAMIRAVLAVAFGIVLLITGTTIAYSVRERTNELAVLKALGFSDRLVLGLVLAESCLIAVVGGGLGLGAGVALVAGLEGFVTGMFPVFYLPAENVAVAVAVILLLGFAAGAPPALRAMRLQVAEALRRA